MVIDGGRFPAPRPPEGLSGPAGRLPWLGSPLDEQQARAFQRAGVALGQAREGAARVLVREDAAVRPEAVAALVAAGRAADRDLAFHLGGEAGALARRLALGREDEPLLVWLKPGGSADPDRIASARPVEIAPRERGLPMPLLVDGAPATLPVTDRLVLPMGHWCQALWANLLGLGPFLWQEILGRNPVIALARLALAAIRSLSLDPQCLLGRVRRLGRRARVHPAAVVEGGWLGEGAVVGAGAVVRASVLGPGVVVEDQALVEGCVLGAGARVQRQAMVKYSVLGEGAAFAGTMQLGVLDRRAMVKHGSVLMDMAIERSVSVDVGERRVEAPFGVLGVCVGEGSTLAAGVTVAPGRRVPPGLTVLTGGDAVVRSIPPGLSGLVEVRDGRLVPR